jgi:hypothetical protein
MPLPVDLTLLANQSPQVPDSPELAAVLLKRRRRNTAINFDSKRLRDLIVRIIMDFNDAHAGHTAFRTNHVEFMDNWRGTPVPNPDGPLGEQSANVRVPLTSTYVEQWKARLYKVICPDDVIAKFYSLNSTMETGVLDEISKWFNWELFNIVDFSRVLNDNFHYMLVDGISLPIPCYHCETKQLFVCHEFELRSDIEVNIQIQAGITQIFSRLGYKVNSIEPASTLGVYNVDVDEIEKLAVVTVLIDSDCLCFEVDYLETVFDGVRILTPSVSEDVVVMNTASKVDDLPFFGLRSWISVGDFWTKFDAGEFNQLPDESEAGRVAAMATAKTETYIPQELSTEFNIIEGGDSFGQPFLRGNSNERLWIELYTWEGTVLLDPDDNLSKRVGVHVVCAPRSYQILSICRLEELNKDACRSPVKQDFIPVPGRFYSMGLSELLRHVQTEMDGIHNFRLDSALVATVPFGFYEPAAGMPHTIIGLRAGQLYPVKRADGVKFPTLNWNSVWGFQEEGLVRRYGSELAGMGDPGVGTYTSKRTSATEFAGTAAALDIRTEYIARIILGGVEQLLYRVFGLYQQHAKGKRIFHVAGADGVDTIRKLDMDMLHGKLKLMLTGDVKQLSKAVEREVATNMLSILLNQILIQMGIVQPDTIYAALDKVVKASDYKGVPIHKPDVPMDSPMPQEEMEMMNAGIYPPPHEGENFAGHLQAHLLIASRQDLSQLMSPEGIQLLQRHIQETYQMQQQIMMQRQMQAAQALQMQAAMAKMGVRPGQAGETSQANTGGGEQQPASPAETNVPANGGGGQGGY